MGARLGTSEVLQRSLPGLSKAQSMNEATLIFPHQLWLDNPAVSDNRLLVFVEDPLFFTQFNFHIKKRILHRASLKAFEELLRGKA